MVAGPLGAALRGALASTLQRFLDARILPVRTAAGAGLASLSIREVARRTGFPRSTLQDFLAAPDKARAATVGRVASLLDDARLQVRSTGARVQYVDAPRWTAETLSDLRPPPGATAFRMVGPAFAGEGYDVGSSEWFSIDEDMAEVAAFAPGGLDGVTRVVFDLG